MVPFLDDIKDPHQMRLCGVMLSIAFGLFPFSAWAQTNEETQSRRVRAQRVPAGDTIRIDGNPDEPFWQQVQPATDFVQREPNTGSAATERTEVRVAFDAERLILAVICYDSEPDRLMANQMQRDQSFEADDRFRWTLDTFLTARGGYFFEINPLGAMGDGLLEPGAGDFGESIGAGINRSWDGIWLARVQRSSVGWTAEIEIPFRTLNFDPNAAAWGINFQRTIRRRDEDSLWTSYALNEGLGRMSSAGRLEGLSQISQGFGLDVRPYVVGRAAAAPGRGAPDTVADGDIGVDAFYNVTPALRLNVSVNTDFAETEVDQRRINLTRFPLFFEEKRDFFLEGSSFFDFSREPGESIMPFFSRRIGLDQERRPQTLAFGAKLTGQAGNFDIGVLQVRSAEEDTAPGPTVHEAPGEDFSVVRIRRRVLQESYFGGLYTLRSTRLPGAVDRHTAGLDFALQTSTFRGNKNLALSGFYLWTSNPLDTGEGSGLGVRLDYPNDPVTLSLSAQELQSNYDPAVGFVERRGYRLLNPQAEYAPRLNNHPWIRSVEFAVDAQILDDTNNRPLTREIEITPFQLNLHDGSRFDFDVSRNYERLEEDFEIHDDIVLPMGSVYEFTRYQLQAVTSDRRVISVGPSVSWGDFFSGRRTEYGLEIGVRPKSGISIGFEAERNILDLKEGSFTTDVFEMQANTQLSPWISIGNNLQYDTVSEQLGWQVRLRWIRRPGNDLYFVYTHNWERLLDPTGATRRLSTLDRRMASKLFYTLHF